VKNTERERATFAACWRRKIVSGVARGKMIAAPAVGEWYPCAILHPKRSSLLSTKRDLQLFYVGGDNREYEGDEVLFSLGHASKVS
jgi:hypothetical protein